MKKSLGKIEEEATVEEPEEQSDEPMDPEQMELERQRKAQKRIHSVKGYQDHENMWEKLINLDK